MPRPGNSSLSDPYILYTARAVAARSDIMFPHAYTRR